MSTEINAIKFGLTRILPKELISIIIEYSFTNHYYLHNFRFPSLLTRHYTILDALFPQSVNSELFIIGELVSEYSLLSPSQNRLDVEKDIRSLMSGKKRNINSYVYEAFSKNGLLEIEFVRYLWTCNDCLWLEVQTTPTPGAGPLYQHKTDYFDKLLPQDIIRYDCYQEPGYNELLNETQCPVEIPFNYNLRVASMSFYYREYILRKCQCDDNIPCLGKDWTNSVDGCQV